MYVEASRGPDHRDTDETAFGKNDIRLQILQQGLRLRIAMDDTEGIREILPVKIPAEFSAGYSVVRHILPCDQLLLYSGVRADIEDFKSCFPQRGQ